MNSDRIRRAMGGLRLLLLVLVLPLLAAGHAEAKYASFIIDADSGRILHQANADTPNYPASLTKMMTLMLAFDEIESGRLSLNSRLPVSARAAGQAPSKLGLKPGDSILVRDAILALVTKSANDVAVVVAEAIGGSEIKFAQLMTAKARTIGMSKTTFRNASGLPNSGQMSTARDMAVLARTLLNDYAPYYRYFSTDSFTYRGVTYGNHNGLLGSYEGTDGIKTGYIRASGFNLVASAKRNGRRLVGVVFGGKTGRSRDRHMAKLLDDGFVEVNRLMLAEATPPVPVHRLGEPQTASAVAVADSAQQQVSAMVIPPAKPAAVDLDQGSASDFEQASARAAGDWGIQVGAYSTPDPAQQIAAKAAATAQPVLGGGGVVAVVPLIKKSGKQLYRARILGISEVQARQACTLLERRKINCMPLRMTEQPGPATRAG